MYHGLRPYGRKIGLLAVDGADLDEGEVGVAGRYGLEGESAEASLPVDARGVGRPTGGDGGEAVVFAMDEGGRLAVAAEEVAGVDVDELEDGWVELELQRDRSDVAAVANHDRDLEGAADGLASAGRDDGEVDGRPSDDGTCLVSLSCGWRGDGLGLLVELVRHGAGGIGG